MSMLASWPSKRNISSLVVLIIRFKSFKSCFLWLSCLCKDTGFCTVTIGVFSTPVVHLVCGISSGLLSGLGWSSPRCACVLRILSATLTLLTRTVAIGTVLADAPSAASLVDNLLHLLLNVLAFTGQIGYSVGRLLSVLLNSLQ